jgi:mannose-6-phosphate isomerase
MLRLQGAAQHYAWGTTNAIPELLGSPATSTPFAEYWLGAHPSAPANAAGTDLDDLISEHPEVLGDASRANFGDQLPYLLKVLSARHALSLQAHPSRAQAEAGFEREQAAKVALDAPERTYRDSWPKPEILIALDEFHTLSGFRDPRQTVALFTGLGVADELTSVIGPLSERRGAAAVEQVFLDVLSLTGERAQLSELVCAAAVTHKDDSGAVGEFARTVIELDEVFPADPGILAALLMNRVVLQPGEAVFVPAGHMHAHLRGTGVEVMANSDNVIRGGLTPKHVDVCELIKVVNFDPIDPEITHPEQISEGVQRYPADCPEFAVWRLDPAGRSVPLPGAGSARVLLTISGSLTLSDAGDALDLTHGQASFLAAGETAELTGDGVAFLAAVGTR